MAYSKITITFDSMPPLNSVLSFRDTLLGTIFLETFRANRVSVKTAAIPAKIDTYILTFSESEDTSNIGAYFMKPGVVNGIRPLDSLASTDNGDGTLSIIVESTIFPNVVDMITQDAIVWPGGNFMWHGENFNGFISQNYAAAFNADYNTSLLYSVTSINGPEDSGLGMVVISANYPNAIFEEISKPPGTTILIENETTNVLTIDDISYLNATSNPVCTHFRVSITTNELATKIILPTSQATGSNTSNPIVFDWPRNMNLAIRLENASGEIVERFLGLTGGIPKTLVSAALNVQINNSPSGATVILSYSDVTTGGLQYSLDGSTWQTSNIFPGILSGSYSARVRNLGCIVSQDFVVDNVTNVSTPYTYISKSMSFRFALRESFQDCGPYKNELNTLSCEDYSEDPEVRYTETQLFQGCDIITTQFKSNFSEVIANVIKPDGTKDPLEIFKKTNNIARKDSREAVMMDLGGGKSGIYFISGNTFDFDTGVATGTYLLNGGLPEYARLGNWVTIGSAYLQIENIIFDEDLNAEVLVIDQTFVGPPEIVVKAIFNRQKYEVYEFIVFLQNYLNQTIRVEISNIDPGLGTINYLSEKIFVKNRHENTIKIDYFNASNTDVFYATGIKNLIRIPLLKQAAGHEGNSEVLWGDDRSNLVSSSIFETTEFTLGLLTTGMYRKVVQALSHKFVKMDNVPYVLNEIGKEGPIESSNLFIVTANMLKSNAPFKSNVQGFDPDVSFEPSNIEIPNVIIDEAGNFITYN